jgi:hypothetical protein
MRLSQINPLAARGIVRDVDLEPARSGAWYVISETFPERTVEVLVEAAPSQRVRTRQAKADAARRWKKARRTAIRELRAAARLRPRLSERQRRLVARQGT